MAPLVSDDWQPVEKAEQLVALGHTDAARELLISFAHTVGSNSGVKNIRRCLDLASQIDAPDLVLHYALCFWCALPGNATAHRALSGAALFHPDPRVAGAGYRICVRRARAVDWCTVAAADAFWTWPQIGDLCELGRHGARAIAQLTDRQQLQPIGADGTGVWVLGRARVTRVGRSVAVGTYDRASDDAHRYVPALSVWDPSAALRWAAAPPGRTYDRLGLLATRFSYSGYWHWLMEGLLHVVRLDEAGLLRSLDRLVICVEGEGPRFIGDSLRAVGIPPSTVLPTSTPFDCDVSELVVPMRAPGFGGLVDETDPSDLREIMVRNAKHDNGPDVRAVRRRLGLEGAAAPRPSRRLLVSRRDATKRRIANEGALRAALAPLGFEVIVPGTLSFAEQVTAFSSAELVVGPHGAGLANALFMPRRSAMLELHHVDFGRPWYKRLAETLGLRYQGVACDPEPTSPRDMLVPVEVAVDHVRNLLETPSEA
jgi:Glycosyltransferase 61